MSGKPIDQAKLALIAALQSLESQVHLHIRSLVYSIT